MGVSTALRLWAAESIPTPWIAPDELIYAELGRAFWRTGHLTLFGRPTQFFSLLSPALAGLPLSLDDRESGYRLLQAIQALVMSTAAVPTYLWARRLTSRSWALVAAALALVPPGLAYSGLIMTEVLFYPVFVLASYAVWRAFAHPAPRTQLFALAAIVLLCAVRLQGFVLALAYLSAIAFDRRRLRAHRPVLIGTAVLAVLWSAWQLRHGGPLTNVLGAYRAAGETHYSIWGTLKYVVYHVADVVFVCGVVPVLALVLLIRPARHDPELRAFVVLVFTLWGWLALQVGVFASRHVGNSAERNLFALIPALMIAVVVWLDRGAPRPRAFAVPAAVGCLLLLLVFPFERFATLAATPSNFTLVPLYEHAASVNLDLAVPLVAAVLLAVALAAPARLLRFGVPLLLASIGAAASIATSNFIIREARVTEALTLGDQPAWIEPLADAPVTWLYTDDLNWVGVWESAFWNPRVRRFYGLLGATVVGGIPQRTVGPYEDGRLVFRRGREAPARYVLASKTIELVGRLRGGTRAGYQLWEVEPPLRMQTWVRGLNTSSVSEDGMVELRRYACRPGTVVTTLVSDTPRIIEVLRNGELYKRVGVASGVSPVVEVPAVVSPPAGTRLCTFGFRSDGPFSAQGLTFQSARGP